MADKTFSEKMDELDAAGEVIKGAIDTLLRVKREGNAKQVAYWVGKLSHDVCALGKECLGEAVLEQQRNIVV